MGLPVTVYRWDDDGAPQVTDRKPLSLLSVLKACLVDGYGAKASLGWSIPFGSVASGKVVFRNSTTEGSGGYVQFWDITGGNQVGKPVAYKHARLMTALDTWIPDRVYNAFGCPYSTNTQWVVIGTSRGFYIIINNADKPFMPSAISYSFTGFFGDFDQQIPTDLNTFIAYYPATTDSSSMSWSFTMDFLPSGTNFCEIYDVDNSSNNIVHKVLNPFDSFISYSNANDSKGRSATPLTLSQVPLMVATSTAAQTAVDSAGKKLRESLIRPLIRGVLPGFYAFAQGGYSDQTWPQIITQDNTTYWMVRQAHYGGSVYVIDMGTWYE
jgi:hypothetical protein